MITKSKIKEKEVVGEASQNISEKDGVDQKED